MEGTADWIFAAGASERSPPSHFLSAASSDQLLGDAIRHPTVEVAKHHLMSQLGLWLRPSHLPWLLAAPVHVSTQPCCRKSLWQTRPAEANHLQNHQTQFSGHSSYPYKYERKTRKRADVTCEQPMLQIPVFIRLHLQCVAMQCLQTGEARHSTVCTNFHLICILVKRDQPGLRRYIFETTSKE